MTCDRLTRVPERQLLSEFVRSCRERTPPEAVGLPAGRRRRTRGLRREEVAAIAGVGLTWYTWFEQGRDIKISDNFLLRLVRGLRLDRAEKEHLFALAGRTTITADAGDESVDQTLIHLVKSLGHPAYIMNYSWDVLAHNRAAAALFEEFDSDRPNLLRIVFFSEIYRQKIKDWQHSARLVLLKARHDYLTLGKSAALRFVLDEIMLSVPEAQEWWYDTEVVRIGDTDISFRNGLGGFDSYRLTILSSEDYRGRRVAYYGSRQA